ncbi:alpha/beta fold hydrolase [Paracoccus sp. 1_MG-2023]|uniref:alpha/beta hydrolase n=1 Tax=unclassified Paracoccus (in: a-proteobacteria) TaxID=2688777 RepID=UPI001C09F62F|nr:MULTISPECIES: alpha/beta fold hydrolase [unclassified Paracoccus (in: a-proteobacteria)]MBU2959075.1 alpha/beta hydrolase [Paracoccus sp. C2R09]MDO6669048.1 alpha/beta fold hydrolase [Paracoccus sp. 1_MG-2023]
MFWARLFAALIVAAAIWTVWPRHPGPAPLVDLPDDLRAWLATREDGIAAQVAARLQWAGEPGARTDIALVYLHGFSASPMELRPLPEDVARAVGANLFVTRLAGHGQGGDALAGATARDWWRDTAQAIAVGRRLGRKVVVIGTSTGATLADLAARDRGLGSQIDGLVFISANYGVRSRAARMLDLPFVRHWLPLVAGRERCFETLSDAHAQGWTSCYPVRALMPLARVMQWSRAAKGQGMQPTLFIWSDGDRVVDPRAIEKRAAEWRGPVAMHRVEMREGDDPSGHVLAGDALSPGQTAGLTEIVADWIRGL